jgi:PAT family beta-lactamase induction signal transducer AmpG
LRFTYFSLYFSEGAPIGFIWWALPSLLTSRGLSTTEIATISAVVTLPWSLKFFMAPFIDLISMKYLSLKKQIFIYQIMMGTSFFFITSAIESLDQTYISIVLFIHGLFAALQDICIDTLAIRSVPSSEIGKLNGIMRAGMLVGRSIFGGAGVYIAHKLGLNYMIFLLIGSIWLSLIVLSRTKLYEKQIPFKGLKKYGLDFIELLKSKTLWLLALTTFFACFSYNGISTVSGAILTKKGASPQTYALTFSVLLPLFMILGALIGGYLLDKFKSERIVQLAVLYSISLSLLCGYAMDLENQVNTLIVAYALFYSSIGAMTATLFGFLMKKTSAKFAALEFSLFMGIVNFSDSTSSYLTGYFLLSNSHLTTSFFIGMMCFPSLVILQFLNRKST